MAKKQLLIEVKATDAASGPVRRVMQQVLALGSAGVKTVSAFTAPVRRLLAMLTSAKTLIAGFIATFAASRVIGSFNSAAKALDEIGKAGRRLGLATEDLSRLRYVAGLADQDFNSLAAAVATLQKNIGQLTATGGGRAKAAFDVLGFDAAYLQGKELRDLLPEIADRLQGLGAAQRQFVAQRLFGDESILNTLEGGGASLRAQFDEAARVGVVFTERQTRAAEAYNDAVTRVGEAWLGVRAVIVERLAPVLETMLRRVEAFFSDMPARVRVVADLIAGAMGGDGAEQSESLERLRLVVLGAVKLLKTGAVEVGKLIALTTVTSMIGLLKAFGPEFADWVKSILYPIAPNYLPAPMEHTIAQAASRRLAASAAFSLADRERNTTPESLRGGGFGVEHRYIRAKKELEEAMAAENAAVAVVEDWANTRPARSAAAIEEAIATNRVLFGELRSEMGSAYTEFTTIWDAASMGPPKWLKGFIDTTAAATGEAAGAAQIAADTAGTEAGTAYGLSFVRAIAPLAGRVKAMLDAMPELRARELDARGEGGAARRLRLLEAQRREAAEADPANASRLARVQRLELQRFDAEAAAAGVLGKLTEAQRVYTESVEQRAAAVTAGTLTERTATSANLRDAEKLIGLADDSLRQFDRLMEKYPEVRAAIEEARLEVERLRNTIVIGGRDGGAGTFGGGFSRQWARYIDDAGNAERAGDEFANAVTGQMTSVSDAIYDTASNLRNAGDAWRAWGQTAIDTIGRVATQMLVLRLISGVAGAFGGGVGGGGGAAAGASGGTGLGSGLSRNFTFGADGGRLVGGVPGRDSIPLMAMQDEYLINAASARRIGYGNLDRMNAGGNVSEVKGGGGGGGVVINSSITINVADGAGVTAPPTLAAIRREFNGLLESAVQERGRGYRAIKGVRS